MLKQFFTRSRSSSPLPPCSASAASPSAPDPLPPPAYSVIDPSSNPHGNLTVVELFQSQGCSSCPPANAHVLSIIDDPNLLILTYDVTYWDHLGWTDTFGNSKFDDRQRRYAKALNRRSVLTPQVIVNGTVDGVGNSRHELETLIGEAREQATSGISFEVDARRVKIDGPEGESGLVLVVYYDPRTVDVAITQGENGGRNIPHRNVVRDVKLLGNWQGGKEEFSIAGIKRDDDDGLGAAILVQARPGGPILGATNI